MPTTITGYDVFRVETPTGRTIGDSTCHYDALDVAVLRLRTSDALEGWGYGESVSKASFTRTAWYFKPMVGLDEIKACFQKQWWPRLSGIGPFESRNLRAHHTGGLSYLDAAVRMALWDLMAKQVELPLYRFLGGSAGKNKVRAYGSLLDFPLSQEQAVALARRFAAQGFFAIKVKVGDPDIKRDLKRLHAVRDAVGPKPELTIDANQNWTCDQAIERIGIIQRDGIELGYVEDPLPFEDVEGFARLASSVNVDIIGHDYYSDPRQARPALERKGLRRLRAGTDLDGVLIQAELSREFGVPLIFGNSMFEINVHAACGLPNVDRLEFSDMEWNRLMRQPVKFENGYGIAPDAPGHGLDPDPEMLRQWSRP